MPAQAALDSCVCVRETEAAIVKHQLIVQLLLKDVREREEGEKENQEERNQSAQNRKGKSSHLCRKTTVKTQNLK